MQRTDEVVILMADDDLDDIMLTKKALKKSKLLNTLYAVHNGQELLDYLTRRGKYHHNKNAPRPGLILLDLNMPKMDGREALKTIKSHDDLRDIPVIVFTTSQAEEDIYRSYQLGVNSFITKPVVFDELLHVISSLGQYWFKIVRLPEYVR